MRSAGALPRRPTGRARPALGCAAASRQDGAMTRRTSYWDYVRVEQLLALQSGIAAHLMGSYLKQIDSHV